MNEARRIWYQRRKEAIHSRVSAYDVLRHNGVDLNQSTDDREEQISCPFHGEDKKPSARVYPEDGDRPSHVWCFVCQAKGWDAIGLWRQFNGGPENCKFSQALSGIERAFGMPTPEPPTGESVAEQGRPKVVEDPSLDGFKAKYVLCEKRLVHCKASFQHLGDMAGYLAAGSILDKAKYRVDTKVWSSTKGIQVLDQLLEKIFERVSKCPGG